MSTTEDTISLTDIEIWTKIGVPDAERETEQLLLISLDVLCDTKTVAETDDLAGGVDYAEIWERVLALAKTPRKTIERFAEDIATDMLKDERVSAVTVLIKKQPLPGVKHVSVQITRKRD